MPNPLTFIIVPTFKERRHVERLLDCFAHADNRNVVILIVNGNPGDDTSRYLEGLHNGGILELQGHPGLFWSGLVNLGLRHVLQSEAEKDYVIIMNADVEFDQDIVTLLAAKARLIPNCQLAAVTVGDRRVVSSGVKVISWILTLNRHPLAGELPEDVPLDALIPVDFLPTRCTLIPYPAVAKAGLVAERELPHYGADNEYSNRIRKLGYQPYIFTGACVRLDTKHTGADVFHRRLSLGQRIGSMFSIKSSYNPICRLRFVKLAYPRYAWPSAMILYLLRSMAEVLLGGPLIKAVTSAKGSGASGS
jgi:GT2 family glycosyltransferase